MSGRARTEAQNAAEKRKRAENSDATKKASQKWRDENPDKSKRGHDIWNRRVSLRTWRIALLCLCVVADVAIAEV